jgi:iron complex outermembrane recepter protein
VATEQQLDDIKRDTVTPRFVIRYKPTEQTSIYASYTKGYKAGIFDLGGGSVLPVRPEKIDAFEVGFKYDDRRLSFETAAFYYDYKDLQVSLFQDARAVIVNAASSEIYGAEAQVRYNVSDRFQVNAGATWVHARYKDFPGAPIYTPCLTLPDAFDPGGCALTGTSFVIVPTDLRNVTMQRTPEFTGNIGARYRTEIGGGELQLSGNLYYTSKFFFGPSGIQFPQKAYEVLSLRAQWTDPSDTYHVALWGDNVTNSRYKTQVQYDNNGIGTNWSKPVTFGVEVGARFR